MTETMLIFKYLDYCYPDEHQAVFMYVTGTSTGHKERCDRVASKLFDESKSIFCPSFTEKELTKTIKEYLEGKRKEYLMGAIKVKPIYHH